MSWTGKTHLIAHGRILVAKDLGNSLDYGDEGESVCGPTAIS